jgi:hypothetical protein
MCQRCREKHREKCREDRRSLRGFGSSVHRHEVSAADVGQPSRRLVICHTCYDLPWRRPHRMCWGRMAAGICPECRQPYAREDTRDAALLCMARESVGPW